MSRLGRGFSLVTLVIALALFAAGLLSLSLLLPVGGRSVRRVVTMTTAAAIAERELSRLRLEYGSADEPPPARLEGRDPGSGYRWEASISGQAVHEVRLVVSWEEKGEKVSETFITRFVRRPAIAGRPETGTETPPRAPGRPVATPGEGR